MTRRIDEHDAPRYDPLGGPGGKTIRWLVGKWYAHQRRLDMQILWPICCEQAPDLDHAKAAFAVHAFNDFAWVWLGQDEVTRIIDRLEPPK